MVQLSTALKILWRWIRSGLLWGAVGGALFGTFLAPGLGTVIGLGYGLILGLGLGIANGLILGLVTAAFFVPVDHKEGSYALFTAITSGIVSLIGMVVGLAALYGINDAEDLSNMRESALLFICIPVIVAVIVVMWRAGKIADGYINPPDEEGYDV